MKNIFKKIQKIESLPARLKNLYNHYIIRNIGFGLLTLFGPIFLYELGGSLQFVIYVFLAMSIFYIFLLPLWARILKYWSMHIFLIIGTVFSTGYVFFYYLLAQQNKAILWIVALLVISNVLGKLFYWIPYHVDFARFVDTHHKGRRISYLWIIISLISIVLPIFSGFLINRFGFDVLFVFAILIVLISIVPAFFISRTRENYSFGYLETFKKMFSGRHFKTNLAYAADGWQSGIGYFVWPIFIFLILDGKYLQ
ncbi:MFS transporter, partial [Patescibacteria group bacterium]